MTTERQQAEDEAKQWLSRYDSPLAAWRAADRPDLLLWLRSQYPLDEGNGRQLVKLAVMCAGKARMRWLKLLPVRDDEAARGWADQKLPMGFALDLLYAPIVVFGPLFIVAVVAVNLLPTSKLVRGAVSVTLPALLPMLGVWHRWAYERLLIRRTKAMSLDEAFVPLWLAARDRASRAPATSNAAKCDLIRGGLSLPAPASS